MRCDVPFWTQNPAWRQLSHPHLVTLLRTIFFIVPCIASIASIDARPQRHQQPRGWVLHCLCVSLCPFPLKRLTIDPAKNSPSLSHCRSCRIAVPCEIHEGDRRGVEWHVRTKRSCGALLRRVHAIGRSATCEDDGQPRCEVVAP